MRRISVALLRLVKNRRLTQNKIQPVLDNIEDRINSINLDMVSGKNKEIKVSRNEAIEAIPMKLIKEYITFNKNGEKITRKKRKRLRKGKKRRSLHK